MSRQHINAYRKELAKLQRVSGSLNEGVISGAFGRLLDRWGRSHDLTLIPQWEGHGPRGNDIRVDGALIPSVLRVPFGYWEAKDSKDDLDREIAAKRASGYPDDNIVYENSVAAVLRQDGREVARAALSDDDALNCLSSPASSPMSARRSRSSSAPRASSAPTCRRFWTRYARRSRRRRLIGPPTPPPPPSSSKHAQARPSTRSSPPPTCAKC